MYKKSPVHYIAKIVIDILFWVSILCIAAIPLISEHLFEWIGYADSGYLKPFTAAVFLSGICCAYILFNLKKMYRSLLIGNPFTDENIGCFRKIAASCGIASLIYIIKCIALFTLASLVIAAVFAVGCLFCLTLKDLFKQAINYKSENELTI